MKHLILGASIFLSLAAAGCRFETPGQERTGPEPPPPPVKFISRDSISQGNYRGITINSSTDEAFSVLEDYRNKKMVEYLSAVNNYFSDVTDLKDRIHLFENVSFDNKFDTDSGVQLQLESGKVKSITLNNRRELTKWPETPGYADAIAIGDQTEVLYNKLVAISAQAEYAHKFERIMLSTRYTYTLYDPAKASLPWSFVYSVSSDLKENVQVHFKNKKVHYVIVNTYQRL